jgi:hypothetical protein
MADQKRNIKEIEKIYKDLNQQIELSNELQKEELNGLSKIFDLTSKLRNARIDYNTEEQKLLGMEQTYFGLKEEGYTIEGNTLKAFKSRLATQKKLVNGAKANLKVQLAIKNTVDATRKIGSVILKDLPTIGGFLSSIPTYLMDSDKAMKNLSLELGFGAENSLKMRNNIQDAAKYSAHLGASVQDLATITSIYADETGRAHKLSAESLKSIVDIGKGTALGVEQASRMGGQFELMGIDAKGTADYVQGIVDTTERMGVNTTKVLKNVSSNFKRLQKFTFRDGVKGFAEMASYAEKFKIDMGQMLDSAEKARTLEGAVELAAKLQVMGGEFAKSDPFQLLFLSRNDPEEFTKKINQMTKGVASFRKNSAGVLETFISPMDIDRLNQVGKALGMQSGELEQQARRYATVGKMRSQMLGLGKDAWETVEGAVPKMLKDGTFTVKVGDDIKKLSQLTKDDVKALKIQTTSLEKRAELSQTFDDVLKNTIMELKTQLLPILKGINWMLEGIRDLGGSSGWLATGLVVGGMLLKSAFALTKAFAIGRVAMGKVGLAGSSKAGASSVLGNVGGATSKGGGAAALGKGAGVGIAAVGAGAGVMLAAKGIGELAKSMENLDKTQIDGLADIMFAMSFGAFAAAPAILALGYAGTAGSLGLLALGAAAVGVGYGINLGAKGIGEMAKGLSYLENVDMVNVGLGMAAIAASSFAFANPLTWLGISAMADGTAAIAANADGMERVGTAFKNISVALSASKDQFKEVRDTINAIASADLGDSSVLSNITQLLSKPLQVEFSDNANANFNANINLKLDSKVIAEETYKYHADLIHTAGLGRTG